MVQEDKTTLYVNFSHVEAFDMELSEALEIEYYRFETYVRRALEDYVDLQHRFEPSSPPTCILFWSSLLSYSVLHYLALPLASHFFPRHIPPPQMATAIIYKTQTAPAKSSSWHFTTCAT